MIRREHGMVTPVFASVDVAFTDIARAVLVEHSSDLTKLKPIPGLNSNNKISAFTFANNCYVSIS